MDIGGLVPFSLSDYPGQVAAVVFAQGCNFRCPFCHNGSLIPMEVSSDRLISERTMLNFLRQRRRHLDAVVVSGGEPTLQVDLVEFVKEVKTLGYLVKLDTNGSRPKIIKTLIESRLVDVIAMDIKAPIEIYHRLAGIRLPVEPICQSIHLIAHSGIRHEFRTTVVDPLLSKEDVLAIQKIIPLGSHYRLQEFRAKHAQSQALRDTEALD